jgi:hypothetical protein
LRCNALKMTFTWLYIGQIVRSVKSSLCLIYKVWYRRERKIEAWLHVFLISSIAARSEVSCTPPRIFLCTHWVLGCVGSTAGQFCVQNCRMYRLLVTDSRSSLVRPLDKSTLTEKCELKNREFSLSLLFQCMYRVCLTVFVTNNKCTIISHNCTSLYNIHS